MDGFGIVARLVRVQISGEGGGIVIGVINQPRSLLSVFPESGWAIIRAIGFARHSFGPINRRTPFLTILLSPLLLSYALLKHRVRPYLD